LLRLDLELERAVTRHALLKRYRTAFTNQKGTDKELWKHLKALDLLTGNIQQFFDVWKHLPVRYRRTRQLQKRFEEHKVASGRLWSETDEDEAWNLFR
jgi:hypothetical protein